MRKKEPAKLRTILDIKIFLLFVLDNIKYPIDYETIMRIVDENIETPNLDYHAALGELVTDELICTDEYQGRQYYAITDKGRPYAAELYDMIDERFRESSVRSAIKYTSLFDRGLSADSSIEQLPSKRFKVKVRIIDGDGEELMATAFTVVSRREAEKIRDNFTARPEGIYKGFLFAATGMMDYLE